MTARGRNLTRIFLALAILAFGPQAQAASPKASASTNVPLRQAQVDATVKPTAKPPAQPQADDQSQRSVDPVIITELRWDGERLIVGTDRLLRFRSFSLRDPDRVVIDLFDAELGDPTLAQAITVETEPIQKIRIGAHPDEGFLRVVIDCDRAVPVQIAQLRGVPRLVIRPQGPAPEAPGETLPAETTPQERSPERQAPRVKPAHVAAKPPSKKAEVFGPSESFGPPVALRAAPARSAARKGAPATQPSPAPEAKVQEARTQEQAASRSVSPRSGREEVGVKLTHAGGSTLLKLQGAKALRLRIQQEVDPARLVVQIPSGTLKGKLPKAKGQVEALDIREDGDSWVLEARLPEGPLDIQNRLEDDGKTLVLAIQRQVLSASKRPLILIDPGHGGDDPGALGAAGAKESEINLAIALKLQESLQARGVNAVLTRTGDVSLDLASRARMIDQLGAQALVSVHANSHDVASALGLETYYRTPVSQPFAQQIHQVLVSDLQRPDRGVREARLFVLRHPTIPSALIEAGFISNPEEEVLLGDREYQQKAAEAIAKGIAGYLSTPVAELSH